jgi:hypothetical protein
VRAGVVERVHLAVQHRHRDRRPIDVNRHQLAFVRQSEVVELLRGHTGTLL